MEIESKVSLYVSLERSRGNKNQRYGEKKKTAYNLEKYTTMKYVKVI